MKDLLGNELNIGDTCLYIKTGTKFDVGYLKIIEFKDTGIICEVVNNNPTISEWRGVFWKNGYITKPLANTNLIKYSFGETS